MTPKQALRERSPRPAAGSGLPVVEYAAHNRGNMQLAIANNGTFGTYGEAIIDPFTGLQLPSCIYPKNSDLVYLWVGAFWIGAVVGRDTLVSVGTDDFYGTEEFWPEVKPFGDIRIESMDPGDPRYSPKARSEQDIVTEYTDTLANPALVARDPTDARNHIPLNIKVTQRTMAWSYSYADDFILFDYGIQNIGRKALKRVYMGIWVDGDVWHVSRNGPEGWNDDIVGFLRTFPAPEGCGYIDTVNIAYHADNDGDPVGSSWDYRSVPHVVGTRIVRTPSDSLAYSFNWWIINYSDAARDFGPRKIGTPDDPFRSFGSRLGTPEGDRNKYYVLSHPEFDYDLLFTALDHTAEGFLPPPQFAADYARGYDTRYLLSFGPFDIDPGQHLPITFAWVGGKYLHTNPLNFKALFNPGGPQRFYESLNFRDLAVNSRWASWVYDNPGVDTDSDGYAGKFRVCGRQAAPGSGAGSGEVEFAGTGDTMYYEGDGVPDFRGASPPPAPVARIIPEVGKLTVRWNGFYSETTPDIFLRSVDFEGYRLYKALDDRQSSFSLITSYDREDYNRYIWVRSAEFTGWQVRETPFSLDSLRQWKGDPDFMPTAYTMQRPLYFHDSIFYFAPQDYNASTLGRPHTIRKVYPEARAVSRDSTTWLPEDITIEHGRPLPKYYEYEYVLDNLQASVPLYVAVTAFDFGSPEVGIASLETSPINSAIMEYPLIPADSVEKYDLDAYVYPNPYRYDAGYAADGYENRDGTLSVDRARRIHFANLPRVCRISIYTLDGDLVVTFDHNYPEGGPQSSHDTWDVITRNTQAPVSGLYYWVVESATRTQIGKLVILQ
ncbi:hypothetical protein C3F09_07115 [candidate division GN15 bacterium]|uniref:T9SS type A sorting domain-containing protein n=1 Tax=candidate division GN15 bacterium TaxID=2072418 RepID=A0A855X056_9BACT|nr:MAG: hypothetical protein C3F09_07115 [candidate division GN15 bacterium]